MSFPWEKVAQRFPSRRRVVDVGEERDDVLPLLKYWTEW